MSGRTILLADMNSFFASVHQAATPHLQAKPVIVCGDPAQRHGIVLAASYPAKAFGVKTGMAVGEARARCPHGIFLKPDYKLYIDYSIRAVQIMKEYSPLVEVFSIDEAFIDVTGCEKLFGNGVAIAQTIKQRIRQEVGISCSIGVGNSKVVAKTAADLQKPDGLTVITREDIPTKYWPLPVEKMFGVGPGLKKKLQDYYLVKTIGDLAHCDIKELKKRFGVVGTVLWTCAQGIDYSPVDPHSLDEAKSIGHQITLPRDYYRLPEIKTVLLELSDKVCQRARSKGYQGRVVGLAIRWSDLTGLYRTQTIHRFTNIASDVFAATLALFQAHWSGYQPVRLLGVTLDQLSRIDDIQLELFTYRHSELLLARTVDAIHQRYGDRSLLRGISLTEGSLFYETGQQTMGGTPHDPAGIPHPGCSAGNQRPVPSPAYRRRPTGYGLPDSAGPGHRGKRDNKFYPQPKNQ